jgi:peptidoglycan/LPS O-acetylase OafA/YrhL
MPRSFSIYLDIVRFTAALLVFLFHANDPEFHATFLDPVGRFGRDAVIAFFVLSGFVIAMVANNKENTLEVYLISRFARLYSVVIAALLLTVVADAIGQAIDPSVYESGHYQGSQPWIRFTTTLFLVHEAGLWSWHPFSNAPFWSISYEFSYYLIFAAFFYLRGYRRLAWGTAMLLLAGPKILLLLPVWMLGVGMYYLGNRIQIGNVIAGLLFVVPVIIYLVFHVDIAYQFALLTSALFDVDTLGRLSYSIRFLHDYVIGILFTLHLAGALFLTRNIAFVIPVAVERPIRYLAGMTFSLYLFHFPLLMLGTALFNNGIVIVLMALLVVALLAPITEGRKDDWKRLFEFGFAKLSKR